MGKRRRCIPIRSKIDLYLTVTYVSYKYGYKHTVSVFNIISIQIAVDRFSLFVIYFVTSISYLFCFRIESSNSMKAESVLLVCLQRKNCV